MTTRAMRANNIHLSGARSNTSPRVAQASDAEVRSVQHTARMLAARLRASGSCCCISCLIDSCLGCSVLIVPLCEAVEELEGVPVYVRPCDSAEVNSEPLGPLW